MLDHPTRVDTHMIWHHIAREPDATAPRTVTEIAVGRLTAKVARDLVVEQRVGRCNGIRIAHHLLDPARGGTAFPEADQPQTGKSTPGQVIQFFIRDLVEA